MHVLISAQWGEVGKTSLLHIPSTYLYIFFTRTKNILQTIQVAVSSPVLAHWCDYFSQTPHRPGSTALDFILHPIKCCIVAVSESKHEQVNTHFRIINRSLLIELFPSIEPCQAIKLLQRRSVWAASQTLFFPALSVLHRDLGVYLINFMLLILSHCLF